MKYVKTHKEKAEIVWYKLFFNLNFSKLISKYRRILKIPSSGYQKTVTYKKDLKILQQFYLEIKEIYDFPEPMFNYIIKYLYYNKIDFKDIDLSGCDITEKENSIYIKVSVDTTITDLKDFINREKDYIRSIQGGIRKKNKLKKKERIRDSILSSRDYYIYKLNKMSNKELEELGGGKSKYKAHQIQNILESGGSKIKISDGYIRKICSRQDRMINKKIK